MEKKRKVEWIRKQSKKYIEWYLKVDDEIIAMVSIEKVEKAGKKYVISFFGDEFGKYEFLY